MNLKSGNSILRKFNESDAALMAVLANNEKNKLQFARWFSTSLHTGRCQRFCFDWYAAKPHNHLCY